MDPFSKYLDTTGERLSTFAVRIGRSPSTLTRALSGARNPSVELARSVERGTNGIVKASEFIAICLDRQAQGSTSFDLPDDVDRVTPAGPALAVGPAFSCGEVVE